MANPTERVPNEWKQSVRRILRQRRPNDILVTRTAREDWAAYFPNQWDYERNEAISKALESSDLEGIRITTMREPGETWEFFIQHSGRKLYVKINLRPDGKLIIIYSIHPPRKGDTL